MLYIKRDLLRLPILCLCVGFCICGCANRTEERDAAGGVSERDMGLLPEDDSTRSKLNISTLDEEQKILSFDMTGFSRDGKKKWDIQGNSADIISDTVLLKDIEANAYAKDRTVNLKAQEGEYDKKNNTIKLANDVLVTTSDGITLATEWLQWESETDVIRTDSFVEVRRDNLTKKLLTDC